MMVATRANGSSRGLPTWTFKRCSSRPPSRLGFAGSCLCSAHAVRAGSIRGGYMIVTAETIRTVRNEVLPSKVPALILLYAHGLLYIARAVLAALGLDRDYDSQLTLLLLLEAHVHTMGMAVLLIAMTKER